MVYFIQGKSTGRIKIGRTNSRGLVSRLRNLQSGSPDRLIVLKVLVEASNDKPYHAQFRSAHVFGEWFSPSDELLQFVASIRASEWDGRTYAPVNAAIEPERAKRVSRCTQRPNVQRALEGHVSRQSTIDRCYRWRLSQGLTCSCGHHFNFQPDEKLIDFVRERHRGQ